MTDDGRLWGLFLYLRPVELPCKMGVVFVRKSQDKNQDMRLE